MEKFLPLTDGQELQIKVSYHRDGRRGYYLSVTPVTRTEHSISYMLFTGKTVLLNQVTRKSAKAEKEAHIIAGLLESKIVQEVLEKENLTLKEMESAEQ